MASAARVVEGGEDDLSGSEDEGFQGTVDHKASLQLIQKTLKGVAAHSEDGGALGFGRNASTITLGRQLWETPPLSKDVEEKVQETVFTNSFPPAKECIEHATRYITTQEEERPALFEGRTAASVQN